MISGLPISSQPISSLFGLDDLVSQLPPSEYLQLLQDPTRERIYLVEISGFNSEILGENKIHHTAVFTQDEFRLHDNDTLLLNGEVLQVQEQSVPNWTNIEVHEGKIVTKANTPTVNLNCDNTINIPVSIYQQYKTSCSLTAGIEGLLIQIRFICHDDLSLGGGIARAIGLRSNWIPDRNTTLAAPALAGTNTFIINSPPQAWQTQSDASAFSMIFGIPPGNNPDPMQIGVNGAEIDTLQDLGNGTWQVTCSRNIVDNFPAGTLVGNGRATSARAGYIRPWGSASAGEGTTVVGIEQSHYFATISGFNSLGNQVPANFTGFLRGTKYLRPIVVIHAANTQVSFLEVENWLMQHAEDTLRFSDLGYKSDTHIYESRADDPFSFDVKLFEDNYLTGSSRIGFGNISLFNNDGALDNILNIDWDNTDILVKLGAREFSIEQFGTIFKGKADQATWDEKRINIRLRNTRAVLDNNIQENLYSEDVLEELIGEPVPLCYGRCRNISPVYVGLDNNLDQVYQIHEGPIQEVETVYFNGYPAVLNTDYTVQLSQGTITVVGSTGGEVTITADVKGHISTDQAGYINTTSDIIREILVTKGNLTYPQDFDTASFSFINIQNDNEVGVYIRGSQSLSSTIDQLCVSIGAYWSFTRLDQVFLGMIDEPEGIPSIILTANNILRIVKVPTPMHIWKLLTWYDKNWTVMDRANLAGAVLSEDELTPDEAAQFISEGKKYLIEENITRTPLAKERELRTLFSDQLAAEEESNRQFELFGATRNIYEVTTKNLTFTANLGDIAQVVYNRFGFDNGKQFRVIGYRESIKSDTLTLFLWG